MSIINDFGKQLKKLRRKAGLTQDDFAMQIGVGQRQITRLETGKSFPSFHTLDAICLALNISPATLFDFSGEWHFKLEQFINHEQFSRTESIEAVCRC